MGKTVVGLFRHSGDADLVAAHLRDAYALDDDKLDVIGEAELSGAGEPRLGGAGAWRLAAFTGIGPDDPASRDPVARRWGDQVRAGHTLVVARSDDPDEAIEIAGEMRRAGADRVDLIGDATRPPR